MRQAKEDRAMETRSASEQFYKQPPKVLPNKESHSM